MRPHEIERPPILFVDVEAVVQELTQEASALRCAEDIRRAAAHRHVGAIAKRRRRITDRSHPDAGHLRAGGGVVDLVDPSGLESFVECDAHARVLMSNRHFSRGTRVGVAQNRSRTVSDAVRSFASTGR